MSTYRPAPASEVPTVVLSAWRVKKIKSKTPKLSSATILVGRDEATGEAHVSSAVKKFDPIKREAVTQSGRVYRLIGASGLTFDAAYVYGAWCRKWKVTEDTDITARYEKKPAAKAPKLRRKVAA